MALKIDRLKSQLITSGLSRSNQALFQVINQLIDAFIELSNDVSSSSGSGSGTTIIQQGTTVLVSGEIGEDGDIGPPGIQGIDGAQGPMGPITLGPMNLMGIDGEDGLPIPGQQGSPGPQGDIGPSGPSYPLIFENTEEIDNTTVMLLSGSSEESSLEPWEGNIVLCAGDGNPNKGLNSIQSLFAGPTPTNITTALGRVSYFKLNTPITVANIRWYGIGATASIYHIAIYRASDNVRVSVDNTVSTTANVWESVADSFTLAADTLYYCVVSADSAGATAGIAALTQTIAASTGQIRALPTAWAGNLDWDNGFIDSYAFAVVTVTAGVLPDPGNAPAAFSGAVTGGMPAIFLDAA